MDEQEQPTGWRSELDERQLKELKLAIIYAEDFHHGTTGHNQLMLIAKLAEILDRQPDSE